MNGNKILVPIDFSEQSYIALEQSFNLARLSGSQILLLHVLRDNKSFMDIFTKVEQSEFKKQISDRLISMADTASKKAGIPISGIVKEGKLLEKILETAKEYAVSYMIIGTHPSNNFKNKLIGHNAFRIVKEANCPVITIKGKHHRHGCSNIVLPIDLTKETREKVNRAIQFAKIFNSKVYCVSVISTNNKDLIRKLNVQMQQVVNHIKDKNIECFWNVLKVKNSSEEITRKLIDYSNSVEGDLIIIMTQQENFITDYIIGSTAAEIIEKSEIPVMSINPRFNYQYKVVI